MHTVRNYIIAISGEGGGGREDTGSHGYSINRYVYEMRLLSYISAFPRRYCITAHAQSTSNRSTLKYAAGEGLKGTVS